MTTLPEQSDILEAMATLGMKPGRTYYIIDATHAKEAAILVACGIVFVGAAAIVYQKARS